jgi:ligand-binding sensor domain-containing protein
MIEAQRLKDQVSRALDVTMGRRLICSLLVLMLVVSVSRARKYNPFVWTTYRECSHIYSIAMNMQEVYFGTDAGIIRFDRLQNRWAPPITESNGFSGTRAELVAMDRTFNKWWILSDEVLSVYVPSISYWEIELPRTSLPLASIHSIGFSQDSVFIAGQSGTYAAARGGFSWHKRNGNPTSAVSWYGKNAGISIKDYPFLTPYYATDPYLNKYEYTVAAVDNKDMWLGTNGYGAFYFNTFTWNGTHYLLGIGHNRVDALFRDGDGFWVGGQSAPENGFVLIDFSTGEGKRFRAEDIYGIISSEILTITGDEWNVWFGTREGLLRYEKQKDLWKTYTVSDGIPGSTVMALQLKAETLFVGTDEGMSIFSPATSQLVSVGEFDQVPVTAFGIHEGTLIIGTDRGAFRREGESFEAIIDPDGDLGFGVSAIFFDSTLIWFGTFRKGVEIYDTDSLSWREFLAPATISSNRVFAIAGNGDCVWIGTDFGVSRYHKKSDTWYTFTENDGLAHNEVYTIYVDSEFVWFGTRDGLTRLRYRDPSIPP